MEGDITELSEEGLRHSAKNRNHRKRRVCLSDTECPVRQFRTHSLQELVTSEQGKAS